MYFKQLYTQENILDLKFTLMFIINQFSYNISVLSWLGLGAQNEVCHRTDHFRLVGRSAAQIPKQLNCVLATQ